MFVIFRGVRGNECQIQMQLKLPFGYRVLQKGLTQQYNLLVQSICKIDAAGMNIVEVAVAAISAL
jgi:hypothetical protein